MWCHGNGTSSTHSQGLRFFRVEKIDHFYEYKKKIQIFDMSLKEATKLHGTKSFTKAPFVLSWDSKWRIYMQSKLHGYYPKSFSFLLNSSQFLYLPKRQLFVLFIIQAENTFRETSLFPPPPKKKHQETFNALRVYRKRDQWH